MHVLKVSLGSQYEISKEESREERQMDNATDDAAVYARIQPRDAIGEFARVLSHLRGPLFILLSSLLSIAMYYAGGAVETGTRAPASVGQVAYFCAITAWRSGTVTWFPPLTWAASFRCCLACWGY